MLPFAGLALGVAGELALDRTGEHDALRSEGSAPAVVSNETAAGVAPLTRKFAPGSAWTPDRRSGCLRLSPACAQSDRLPPTCRYGRCPPRSSRRALADVRS